MADRAQSVWAALAEMYGRTLVTNYGAEPPTVWRAKIGELSDAQVANGLRSLSEKPSQYPPTLGEFVAACKGSGSPRMLGQSLDDSDVKRLSGPPAPGRHGLPSGMSAIAYRGAEVRAAGMLPNLGGCSICASSLPPKHHAAYLAGRFENAAQHREYLRRSPGYRERLQQEFAAKWGVSVDIGAAMESWAA